MPAERIIGVDFGTSTSVIRVKRYTENGAPIGERFETKEVVFGGKGGMVPTLIQKKIGDPSVVYFGYEAEQKRRNHTLYQGFKVELESQDPDQRALARILTAEFYGYLAKQYKSQSDGGHLGEADDRERTIISYPVKWKDETKQFVVEAAIKAGFPSVEGMDEAQAAIQAALVQSEAHLKSIGLLRDGVPVTILLIDMGAGTTDLVLCNYTPGDAVMETLNTWPRGEQALFGGRELDQLLQGFFRPMLSPEIAESIFQRIGVEKFKGWKETVVSPALLRKAQVEDFEALDSCLELLGQEIGDYRLDRAGFETLMEAYLKQFPTLINDCIRESPVKGDDVDLVIVTGGHSQWYFVDDILTGKSSRFGTVNLPKIKEASKRLISIARPQETVALGLAFQKTPISTLPKPAQKKAVNSAQGEQISIGDKKQFQKTPVSTLPKPTQKKAVNSAQGEQTSSGDKEHTEFEEAMTAYREAYMKGVGVDPQAERKAVKLFRKLANQGHSEAQFYLGECYKAGLGVKENYEEAEHWCGLAAKQGDKAARKALERVRQKAKQQKEQHESVRNMIASLNQKGADAQSYAKIHIVRRKRFVGSGRDQFIRIDKDSTQTYRISNGDDYMITVSVGTHCVELCDATYWGNNQNWTNPAYFPDLQFSEGDVLLIDLTGDVKVVWES